MSDQPAQYEPMPIDGSTPDDGAEIATVEWLLVFTDAHVLQVTPTTDTAVMAAGWALGFPGVTRLQVWWVLRDERLRRAYGAIVRALVKLRPADAPEWTMAVSALPPAERAHLIQRIEHCRAVTPTKVPVTEPEVARFARNHPDAVIAPGSADLMVPAGALGDMAAAARSVTAHDIDGLLDRARGPFQSRLDEAARVSGDATTTFLARKRRSVA